MYALVRLGFLALSAALPAAAQSTCSSSIAEPAHSAEVVRKQLRVAAVRKGGSTIPPAVATQLTQFKDQLVRTADAAFRCAPASILPETLEGTLAAALHANLPVAGESSSGETGSYGSDLTVQVFQLFGKPKLFYVDFRYGIACGDDHLMLIYQTASDAANDGWHQWLRWDAHGYNDVASAFGDFVLLAPLTGSDKAPTWRFLVAHGQPGCGDTPRTSHFDLDLLTPTGDPSKPAVSWHFEHAYTAGSSVPRLATTENTIEFRLTSSEASEKKEGPSKASESFRFRLTADGQVETLPKQVDEDTPPDTAQVPASPASTHSPQ